MIRPVPGPLYEELYRCMHCAGAVLERGVRSFVQAGPGQTIPASHFGHISTAKIWLIGTNPKGNRKDSNVGFRPRDFVSRSELTQAQVAETFDHFSTYFNRGGPDAYFERWIETLNGLEIAGQPQTWQAGGICCVDLVKCPTQGAWGGVVRPPDKALVYGCFEESGPRRYLKKQVELHGPRVLIFSAGLAVLYAENRRRNRDLTLRRLWPQDIKEACTGVWETESRSCLSIGLGKKTAVSSIEPVKIRSAIQRVIQVWEARGDAK